MMNTTTTWLNALWQSSDLLWPAWVAGGAIGLLAFAQRWLTDQPLGCSAAFGNACARLGSRLPLFQSSAHAKHTDWKLWFLGGIFLGGLLASLSTGRFAAPTEFGSFYTALMPQETAARILWWLFGGIMIGLGSRMAGGCTSGHTINGVAMGSPASLVASLFFFAAALVTAQVAHWVLATAGALT
ncbi:YeeE/YedE thiosulfate transporter family protein [Halothiobacillus sp. DCM-1]|uniref:YeeE/YedE thiosulfate transporter family protein n=1 Tax=Halothiobacillus sp. DCM-1 TaxID=3112558 RepID=UPI003246414B